MKYVRRLNLAALGLAFTKVRPWRMLLLALVVGGVALVGSRVDTNASHSGAASTKLWAYGPTPGGSGGCCGAILEYDIGSDQLVSACNPGGHPGGLAFDPVDRHLWYTTWPGDGMIFKTTPPSAPISGFPPPCDSTIPPMNFIDGRCSNGIPGSGAAGCKWQDDVGALDVDPDDNNIWAAGFEPSIPGTGFVPQDECTSISGCQSYLYKVHRAPGSSWSAGDLIQYCSVPSGANNLNVLGNNSLAVAKIPNLGPGTFLLTDAGGPAARLMAVAANTCVNGAVLTPTMLLPKPGDMSGIDYESIDGHDAPKQLIGIDPNTINIDDFGTYPFGPSTATMSTMSGPFHITDITLGQCFSPPTMEAWWKLDETGGTTITNARSSVGLHDGTPMPGAVGFGGPVPAGTHMVVGALDFLPGMFVGVPTDPGLEPGGGNFSIDAWVYPVTTGPNLIQPIVDKRNSAPNGAGYVFYIQNALPTFQYTGTLAGTHTVSSNATLPYNQWSHVAVTLQRFLVGSSNATDVKLYINGQVQVSQVTFSDIGAITNGQALLIGGTRLPGPAFQGEIALDEVEIFRTAVSQPDIAAIYGAGSYGKCAPSNHPIAPTPPAESIGGVAALTVSSSGSPVPWAPLAAVAAGVMAVMGAGLWYGRRRWLR